ncbi:phage tail length tape measure family protein, partial [Stenotrophomonas maltophilia]|uniref:phage tail length tape measure family protein n=1 Tax=Stenotrophomonas maltophilia TaxID=40324 RepID=UPI001C60AFA8
MRQLPAQITDITTSIVSGMPIWMVAIQQGGQLKDSFGGVVPAARALAGAITPTIAVVGGLAAAVGGLVLAWKQAADEEMAFQRALIVTNNYAATSTANLQTRRDQLTGLQGVSRGNAAEALTKVAQTGRFTGEQFELVARSAAK